MLVTKEIHIDFCVKNRFWKYIIVIKKYTFFYTSSSLFIEAKRTVEVFLGALKSLGLSFLKCLKVSVSVSAILYSCFALVLLSLTGQLIKSSLVIFSRQSSICFLYILNLMQGHRNVLGRGGMVPTKYLKIKPIPTLLDYAHHIGLSPPSFLTFWGPCNVSTRVQLL